MLVVINFDRIEEEYHVEFRTALALNVNVKDWHQFFGNSYLVKYETMDNTLNGLTELCKAATRGKGKTPHYTINPLNKGFAFRGPQSLLDFTKKYNGDISGKMPAGEDNKTLIKEKSPLLINPEALLLKEQVKLENLNLDPETKAAVQSQLARARFRKAAAAKGVTLPDAYQNVLISGKPGVGKSTLAKALALKLQGLLSEDRKIPVYFVKAAQLIGAYRGHTQMNMQGLLDHAGEGIVILDEIDTYLKLDSDDAMILNVLNTHMGDKPNSPVVFVTLYEGNKQRFMNFNEGFQRRFANNLAMAAQSDEKLMEILADRIRESGLGCDPAALAHMRELIPVRRRAQGPNFGNIGEVNNILEMAIKSMAERFERAPTGFEFKILAQDVPEYDPQSGKLKPRLPVPANDDVVGAIAGALSPEGSAPPSNVVPFTLDKG